MPKPGPCSPGEDEAAKTRLEVYAVKEPRARRGMSRVRPQACRNLNYVSLKHTRWSGSAGGGQALRPGPHVSPGALSLLCGHTLPFSSKTPQSDPPLTLRGLLAPNGSPVKGVDF